LFSAPVALAVRPTDQGARLGTVDSVKQVEEDGISQIGRQGSIAFQAD
jgi:hypothetical protein